MIQEPIPPVTVVTVNFNMRAGLEKTVASVQAQSLPGFEFIVVDGASTDGSTQFLQNSQVKKWVSEPDRNLYDGMNKGVALSTGSWIVFMNSGDSFADKDVLRDIFASPHDGIDVLYGNAVRLYDEGMAVPLRAQPIETLKSALHCSHQAIFMRRELLLANPFALDLLISDYQLVLASWLAGRRFRFVDRTIAIVSSGGRSDEQRRLTLTQRKLVLERFGLFTFSERIKHPLRIAYATASLVLRKRLPTPFVRAVLGLKSLLK